jgi:hypothetical protein
MALTLAERPANGGLLRISFRSPGSNFGHSQTETADSLRGTFEKLPFLGACGWRLNSICTARPELAVEYRQILRYDRGQIGNAGLALQRARKPSFGVNGSKDDGLYLRS